MTTKQNTEQIYALIPQVMLQVGAIPKNRRNAAQGYSFRGIDDVYNALQDILAKLGLFTLCVAIENEMTAERKTTSGGTLFVYQAHFVYRIYAPDGSFLDTHVVGKGMDSGDKETNKAMSVAHKYALLQAFCIPTDDDKDPENDSHAVSITTVRTPQTSRTVSNSNEVAPTATTTQADDKQRYKVNLAGEEWELITNFRAQSGPNRLLPQTVLIPAKNSRLVTDPSKWVFGDAKIKATLTHLEGAGVDITEATGLLEQLVDNDLHAVADKVLSEYNE